LIARNYIHFSSMEDVLREKTSGAARFFDWKRTRGTPPSGNKDHQAVMKRLQLARSWN
jgi:hypothetical protein